MDSLRELSIKRCPNINSLPNISQLESLGVEGIVTLKDILPSHSLESLNITDCVQIENINFVNLRYLKASNISLNKKQIDQIVLMKNLRELDISWNTIVDDNILEDLLNKIPSLEKISVFGCFRLSKRSAEFTYKNYKSFKVIGNPYETKYLLDEF